MKRQNKIKVKNEIEIQRQNENEINRQNEINKQNEIARQKEIAMQNEINKQNEINSQNEINRQNEINKQNEIARQKEIAMQNEINRQNEIARQKEIAMQNEINKQNEINRQNEKNKEWYNWESNDDEIRNLKLKYFSEDAFVICISGQIAINNYPKSLLESIKILREQDHNIHLLLLGKLEVNPRGLTKELYNEITSYDWVKSFTVDKKEILNYYRFCDVLASTYRDYSNHVIESNKIKEYLLCDKPILCSRGKQREIELGKDYFGLYDCNACDTVPPLFYTEEYLKNPDYYLDQYEKYFREYDVININKSEINYIKGILQTFLTNKTIVAVIPVYGREPLLKYTIRRLYEKNKINHVIVIGESKSEENVAFNEGAIFLKHKNNPLGKKWNAGVMFTKKFNPDALIFVGSSDWISDDWIETAYLEITKNVGYVGKQGFDMMDITNSTKLYCKWYGYVCDRKNETIGIGRLLTKQLLEIVNYEPFSSHKNHSMDYDIYLQCIKHNMKIKILNNDSIFLSISCDLWKNMHCFFQHYYGCEEYTSNKIYNIKHIGCINKRHDKNSNKIICDFHLRYGCEIEINNYHEYKNLYRNGRIYNKEDIEEINKKFTEINNFYNDYVKIRENII